jgi:hypothetical protein
LPLCERRLDTQDRIMLHNEKPQADRATKLRKRTQRHPDL